MSVDGRAERGAEPGAALRINNFDLLRVVAAAQVAFFHLSGYLRLDPSRENPLVFFAHSFPGVPVFFVVSGFLISLSWEKNPSLGDYLRNRALRIFPALWVCFAVAVIVAATVGHVDFLRLEALPWLVAQLSFFQFYTPGFLRDYGTGSLNGSLWTIPIELQFYALVPLLYRLGRRRDGRTSDWPFVSLFVVSVAAQLLLAGRWGSGNITLIEKLLLVSIVPNLWMFLVGVLLQRYHAVLAPWIAGKGLYWVVAHLVVAWIVARLGGAIGVNAPNPISMIFTGVAVISLAFTAPGTSRRVLRGNDVSYGLYIYHAVVLNVLIELRLQGSRLALMGALAVSAILAVASWVLVERPTLRLKRTSLKTV